MNWKAKVLKTRRFLSKADVTLTLDLEVCVQSVRTGYDVMIPLGC